MNKKVAVIINGSRKLNGFAQMTLDRLKKDDFFDVQILTTSKPKQAIHFAKSASDDGFDFVIAVGGDGTCNEVVNGIMASENSENVIFGIIPNGTGNDFHKMLGEFDPRKFVEFLKNNISQPIDIIQLKSEKGSYFALNIAGIGFDGHVVQTLESFRNTIRMKGKFAYALAILKSFSTFKKVQVEINSLEYQYNGKLLLMAVCNGQAFGHGLFIHPHAHINDGKLNVTVLGNVSFLDYVKNLGKLKRGEFITHPEVKYFQTESISLHAKDKQLFTEVDGENCGTDSFSYSVRKDAIRLVWDGLQATKKGD